LLGWKGRELTKKTRVSHVIPCDIEDRRQRQPSAVFKLLSSRSANLLFSYTGHTPTNSCQSPLDVLFFTFFPACTFRYTRWAVLVRFTTFAPGITRSVVPYAGWLFLFAVLMAAALLFTMVFFVRFSFHSIHNQFD
jgi:hypothetical protein